VFDNNAIFMSKRCFGDKTIMLLGKGLCYMRKFFVYFIMLIRTI